MKRKYTIREIPPGFMKPRKLKELPEKAVLAKNLYQSLAALCTPTKHAKKTAETHLFGKVFIPRQRIEAVLGSENAFEAIRHLIHLRAYGVYLSGATISGILGRPVPRTTRLIIKRIEREISIKRGAIPKNFRERLLNKLKLFAAYKDIPEQEIKELLNSRSASDAAQKMFALGKHVVFLSPDIIQDLLECSFDFVTSAKMNYDKENKFLLFRWPEEKTKFYMAVAHIKRLIKENKPISFKSVASDFGITNLEKFYPLLSHELGADYQKYKYGKPVKPK